MSDDQYDTGDAYTSTTYSQLCSGLRKDGYVMIKGRPCRIVEISTSTTGKHGFEKVHVVGLDIFTGRKCEDIWPSTQNVDVPNVSYKEYKVTNIEDGYLSLMDDTREDLKLPEGGLGEDIQTKFENDESFMVTVLKATGEELVVGIKQ